MYKYVCKIPENMDKMTPNVGESHEDLFWRSSQNDLCGGNTRKKSCRKTFWASSGKNLSRPQKFACRYTRDVEAAISSTASASNRAWALSKPGLYLIYQLADKHDYQNQQLTIYKGTLLVKMIA